MPEKILVVDDDVDTLRLVGLMLQRQGYQIVAANNGQQALASAQSEDPDLILLDVMMPDMDGYEVTRKLRASPNTASIPIIMFTAKSQVDDKVEGFDAGVDDYLTKPTQPRELFAHVKAVLARGKKGRTSAPAAEVVKRDRGHAIGVLAAKPGMGVSSLAINLGVCLRDRADRSVIVAEFRPGLGSIALDLGYQNPDGLNRLLQKKAADIKLADVDSELTTHPSEIRMLPASYKPADAKMLADGEKFEAIARHLVFLAAFIVLDLGANINPITEKVLPLCDELIVLLEPNPTAVLRTSLLIEELISRGFGEGRINTVLYNRVRSDLQLSLNTVQQQFKYPISVVFTPAPELAYQAARNNVPLVIQQPDSLTTQQFMKLSDNITKHVRSKA